MTTRSIVLSTAALLLVSAAAPAPFGFAPAPVVAQDVSADIAAALAGDPAELHPRQLRQHIDTLRSAIDAGAVDERQARAKLRAYAEALRAQRAGGQERNAERQAQNEQQPGRGAERRQEQQAERERRQQERQAERERRQQERQAERERRQQERQAEQEQRRQERAERERRREEAQRAQRAEQERRQEQAERERRAEQERRQQERAERERRQQEQAERERQAEQERRQQERAERERRQQEQAERERQAEQERRQQERAERERRQQEQAERERRQPGQAERERRQQEQAERERRQERAERERRQQEQAERERRQQEQAEQERRRQEREQAEQRNRAAQTAAQVAGDNRPASALQPQELRRRIDRLREAIETGVLSGEEMQRARAQMRADRDELRSQLAERQRDEPRRGRERTGLEEAPRGEIDTRAQNLLRDDTPARRLEERTLRRRLQETRELLATGQLSRDYERALRQRLREDREEIRSRRSEQAGDERRRERTSRRDTRIDVDVHLERRRPADRLSDDDLERRVRQLQRALREERIARRDAEIARHIIEQDRRELRQRLRAQRERRREAMRQARRSDDLNIDFRVEFRPPPVIYAAEAAMEEIEVQLVAPPLYQPQRAYSFQEIVTNHEVRQAMPGIEVDTLNFDFGSAEVRPEEIDKLDTIADVIERIVAARPDEVFLIEGHTDAVGSDAANLALSRARAAAVEEALVYYYAIDPANLRTVGLGEHFLRIPTPEPEEENRRVTVRRITPLLAGRG